MNTNYMHVYTINEHRAKAFAQTVKHITRAFLEKAGALFYILTNLFVFFLLIVRIFIICQKWYNYFRKVFSNIFVSLTV